MSLALRTRTNRPHTDGFSLARELLGWDPFYAPRQQPPTAFAPAFEVKETSEAFVLRADLPGVAQADLEIAVHASVLTVAGHRQAEDRKEGDRYALYERPFGSFTRSFSLPETADGDKVDAKLADGVLTLTIAKKLEAKPRKIAIQT